MSGLTEAEATELKDVLLKMKEMKERGTDYTKSDIAVRFFDLKFKKDGVFHKADPR